MAQPQTPPPSIGGLPIPTEMSSAGFFSALQSNPYFEAGFGLSLFGTALAAARGGAKGMTTMARRHMLVTMEVTSKDRAYPWVLSWLTEQV